MIKRFSKLLNGSGGSFCLNNSQFELIINRDSIPNDTGYTVELSEGIKPKFHLAFDIQDKNLMDKFFASSVNIKKQDSYFEIQTNRILNSPVFLTYNDKFGIMTTDMESIFDFNEGKKRSSNLTKNLFGKNLIKDGFSFHIYTDLSRYPNLSKYFINRGNNSEYKKKNLTIWNEFNSHIEFKIVDDNNFEFSYNFKEHQGNSAQNILELIDGLYVASKASTFQ